MKPFIFDKRNGIHIIDLTKTLVMLNKSIDFVHEVAITGDSVLFVGTKKQAQGVIKEAAEMCAQPYVTTRWLGGMLTNSKTIRGRVKRLKELEAQEESGAIESMLKKEASKLRQELAKLRRNLSGVADMEKLPGALFVVDINREAIAVAEANKLNIPVIAMTDTNTDPDQIDFPIPGNDDAIRAIKLISQTLARTTAKAREEYERIAAEIARKKAEEEEIARKARAKAEEERAARAAEAREAEKKAKAEAEKRARADKEAKAKAKAEAEEKADKEAKAEAKAESEAKEAGEAEVEVKEGAETDAPPEVEPEAKLREASAQPDEPESQAEPKTAEITESEAAPESEENKDTPTGE